MLGFFKRLAIFPLTIFVILFAAGFAMAQDAVTPGDFLNQVLSSIQGFGGLSWFLKVSAVITLIVSSMKVSFLKTALWDKLGQAQVWVAPLLALLAGLVTVHPLSLPAILAYVGTGVGAVALHEFLDSIKAAPGLGPKIIAIINLLEGFLGGGSQPPAALK